MFESKSIVLAGGYSVYTPSSSRIFENYGEGTPLAYEAGLNLVDMEMVQFHPTGMVWPKKALGTLATEAYKGRGRDLLILKGERFMKEGLSAKNGARTPRHRMLGRIIMK